MVGVYIWLIFVIEMKQIVEFYICCWVICYFEKGRVVIFFVGIGSFYFIMDFVVVLCVNEINVDVILKGICVDGIYNVDLEKDVIVIKFDNFIFVKVISMGLSVMDMIVFIFCWENNLLIIVFDINIKSNFKDIVEGKFIGIFVEGQVVIVCILQVSYLVIVVFWVIDMLMVFFEIFVFYLIYSLGEFVFFVWAGQIVVF